MTPERPCSRWTTCGSVTGTPAWMIGRVGSRRFIMVRGYPRVIFPAGVDCVVKSGELAEGLTYGTGSNRIRSPVLRTPEYEISEPHRNYPLSLRSKATNTQQPSSGSRIRRSPSKPRPILENSVFRTDIRLTANKGRERDEACTSSFTS